jgi:hypothetical protein
MSAKNGDKSRHQINRKRVVLRRAKIRDLVKAAKSDARQGRGQVARAPSLWRTATQVCTPGASWPVRATYSTYDPG